MRARIALFLSCISLIGLGALSACSSSSSTSSAAPACSARFSGNVEDQSNAASCATIGPAADDAGVDYALQINSSSQAIGGLEISIDLGASPTTGTFSSDTIPTWSAIGLTSSSANCAFSAGNTSVPSGNFVLNLTSAAASGSPHGTLDLTLFVHAPPMVDCGYGDTESVHLTF